MEAALSHLGLAELMEVFLKEQIDFDSLVSESSQYAHDCLLPVFS